MPATVGLVLEVREELRADLRGLEARMDSRFAALEAKMDSRFSGIDGRFAEIDGRFAEIDVRFSEIDARFSAQGSKIEQILAAVHRTQAIVEEQRSENRVMLEALNGFVQRMDHLEKRQR